MSIVRQFLLSCVVCTSSFTLGIMYSWPSSTLNLFASADTPLHRPMTDTELALLGSLSSVSALISTPISGFLLDILGRKYTTVLCSLPQVISWMIVCLADRVEAILAAVCLSGMSGGTFLVTPIYISEICQESIRGAMTSCAIVFFGFGLLTSYLLGGYLSYQMMNYVGLAIAVAGVAMMTIVKESPVCLMKKKLEKDAADAIAYFRGVKRDSKEVLQELNNIRRALNPDFEGESSEEQKLKPRQIQQEKLSLWQFVKKSESTRRALIVSLVLYTVAIFQGLVVVQVYAEPLFEEALPSMSATVSSVLFAVITVLAGLGAAYLVELAGRRPLMIYSSIGAGICCVVLGTQVHLHWGPHWVTGVFIYLFCIMYTFGAGTVPFVIVAEVFLPEVRSIISMIAVEWCWICNFVILFIFNPLVAAMGLGPVFYLFAVVCVFSAIFCYFCLPETKGLTVDVIQELFVKRRRNPMY